MFKRNILIYSLFVSATCTSSLTFADPWRGDRDDDFRGGWQQQHAIQHDRPSRHYQNHQDHGPVYNNDHRYSTQYIDRRWQRGNYVPQAYRGQGYRVNNWRGRGLPTPRQGQRWLNVDGQYILIAAATGIITSILLHQ